MRNTSSKLAGSSIVAAFTASLCCITPLLAVMVGATGVASSFDWVEPLRPYLIGITIAVLGLAWYQRLKPGRSASSCDCEQNDKFSFWKSNRVLLLVSCLALLLLTFPNYAGAFYGQTNPIANGAEGDIKQTMELKVEGMTCAGCEAQVSQVIGEVPGVFHVSTSYKAGSATISYDSTRVKPLDILQAAKKTGYTVEVAKKK
ncbi:MULTISPECIES: mercuric transport protein MerTP [Pontibacter]|uniref:Mercuric transport protein MerT n=1 Tax=Pontibacter virosus TaxID=1765052 RepID=A0A2U1B4S5_9BACT|nr:MULTISPECIES: mercuric transport protein MerTP [Pontibacter]PVY43670.1 copper chaperone CopZ [Pontibacter virosus]QCR25253.1 heavy metal transporter [Pontibacter sp. SGAir0037]